MRTYAPFCTPWDDETKWFDPFPPRKKMQRAYLHWATRSEVDHLPLFQMLGHGHWRVAVLNLVQPTLTDLPLLDVLLVLKSSPLTDLIQNTMNTTGQSRTNRHFKH